MGGAASLLLALAMAPTGRSEDTASEVFSRETELMVGEGVEALPREPLYPEGGFAREGYELLTSQDAVLVETEKGFIQSWRLRVAWDGAAAGRLRMDVPAEDGAQTFDVDRVFEECVRPLATAVEHAARSIGGYGRAHVVLGINASQVQPESPPVCSSHPRGPWTSNSAMGGRRALAG